MSDRRPRVIVIGFDGATLDLIKPWAKKGYLMNFDFILKNGIYGELRSTLPPISPTAWTSMVTGKNPGKHNIFGFLDRHGNLVNAKHIKCEAIWDILDRTDMGYIAIGVPLTLPQEKKRLRAGQIIRSLVDDTSPFEDERDFLVNKDNLIKRWFKRTQVKTEKALRIFEKEDWNLFFMVLYLSDFVPTLFWKYMDTNHPDYYPEGGDKYGTAILRSYKILDNTLGKFLSHMNPKEDIIFVVSDHGIGPAYRVFNINNWLSKEKFLFKKEGIRHAINRFRTRTVEPLLKSLERSELLKRVVRVLPQKFQEKVGDQFFPLTTSSSLNMKKTLAFAYSHGSTASIWIYGEEGEERNEIIEKLIDKLRLLRDPISKQEVITRTFRNEQIYSGPCRKNGPDLLIQAKEWYSIRYKRLDGRIFSSPIQSGDHTKSGVFMAWGKSIKNYGYIGEVRIYDVAPTILHILSCAIPDDTDGKVIKRIFEPESEIGKREVKRTTSKYAEKPFRTSEEEEKTRKRLRLLGYI